jgi:preprotein translocase subunit SecF
MSNKTLRIIGLAVGVLLALSLVLLIVGGIVSTFDMTAGVDIMVTSVIGILINTGLVLRFDKKRRFEEGLTKVWDF